MKRPIIVVLAALTAMAGTGGAIALTGGSHENAAVAQYGCTPGLIVPTGGCVGEPGPPGENGNNGNNGNNGSNGSNGSNGTNGANGANGFDGSPGANGQNGAPGTVTTIIIQPTTPLPGTAKPTTKNRTRIRVCKRYPYKSAKFHGHVFYPKTCWYRYV